MKISNSLKLQIHWDKLNRLECMEFSMTYKSVSSHRALLGYVLWGIWLTRNKLIFEDKEAYLRRLSHHNRVSYVEGRKRPKDTIPRSLKEPIIDHTYP
jgi:hypothetical protein